MPILRLCSGLEIFLATRYLLGNFFVDISFYFDTLTLPTPNHPANTAQGPEYREDRRRHPQRVPGQDSRHHTKARGRMPSEGQGAGEGTQEAGNEGSLKR